MQHNAEEATHIESPLVTRSEELAYGHLTGIENVYIRWLVVTLESFILLTHWALSTCTTCAAVYKKSFCVIDRLVKSSACLIGC